MESSRQSRADMTRREAETMGVLGSSLLASRMFYLSICQNWVWRVPDACSAFTSDFWQNIWIGSFKRVVNSAWSFIGSAKWELWEGRSARSGKMFLNFKERLLWVCNALLVLSKNIPVNGQRVYFSRGEVSCRWMAKSAGMVCTQG